MTDKADQRNHSRKENQGLHVLVAGVSSNSGRGRIDSGKNQSTPIRKTGRILDLTNDADRVVVYNLYVFVVSSTVEACRRTVAYNFSICDQQFG